MVGNVWEWAADAWVETYDAPSSTDAYRPIRGGDWSDSGAQGLLTTTSRVAVPPYVAAEIIGFRPVRDVPSADGRR